MILKGFESLKKNLSDRTGTRTQTGTYLKINFLQLSLDCAPRITHYLILSSSNCKSYQRYPKNYPDVIFSTKFLNMESILLHSIGIDEFFVMLTAKQQIEKVSLIIRWVIFSVRNCLQPNCCTHFSVCYCNLNKFFVWSCSMPMWNIGRTFHHIAFANSPV